MTEKLAHLLEMERILKGAFKIDGKCNFQKEVKDEDGNSGFKFKLKDSKLGVFYISILT